MPRWTEEARAKQREVIMKSKPWEKTTGPKTPEGKKIAAQNSLKHGMHSKEIRELLHFLWLQRRYRHAVMKEHKRSLHSSKTPPPLFKKRHPREGGNPEKSPH